MDPNTPYTSDQYLGDTNQKGFFERLSGYLVEFIETLVVFGAIFASIYLFVAQFHKVSGNSMVPTFHNGDYLITEKVSYRLRTPKRGEIIVLNNGAIIDAEAEAMLLSPAETISDRAGYHFFAIQNCC